MKYIYLSIIFITTLTVAVSCSTSKKASSSAGTTSSPATSSKGITQEDADYVSKKIGMTTVAELTEGGTLYSAECGVCHGLKKPNARTEDQWKTIVPNMVVKANAKAGKVQINEEQQSKILKYLTAMCVK